VNDATKAALDIAGANANGVVSTVEGHHLEGSQVSVALRVGDRLDDCQLVSAPGAAAAWCGSSTGSWTSSSR
jgi:hypothetical protein